MPLPDRQDGRETESPSPISGSSRKMGGKHRARPWFSGSSRLAGDISASTVPFFLAHFTDIASSLFGEYCPLLPPFFLSPSSGEYCPLLPAYFTDIASSFFSEYCPLLPPFFLSPSSGEYCPLLPPFFLSPSSRRCSVPDFHRGDLDAMSSPFLKHVTPVSA